MSETEHNFGKLTPVTINVDAETTAKDILLSMGVTPDLKYHGTYRDQLSDEGYRKYYISGQNIYKVTYESTDGNSDIFKAAMQPNGVIEFETRYYNGGCSFNEALDCAVVKVKL